MQKNYQGYIYLYKIVNENFVEQKFLKFSTLILLRGKPAAGKSFVARFLSKELNIPFIDKDDIKDAASVYFADQRVADQFSYHIMFNIVESYLKNNSSIICDSPLYPPYAFFKAKNIAQKYNASIKIVHVIISDVEEWKRRLDQRMLKNLSFHRYAGWESHKEELLNNETKLIPGELLIDIGEFNNSKKDLLINYLLENDK